MSASLHAPAADRRPREGRAQGAVMRVGRGVIRTYGEATSALRPDPDFLVVGAKRGGTTSLYYDLLDHPGVCPLFPAPDRLPKATATKGTHYFDINYYRGERWYRSHLPTARARRRSGAGPVVTGEASPYYLFHPAAAGRAAELLPQARIVAILRDPVDRAHSHWKERRRAGAENLSFVDALAAEPDRVGALTAADFDDPRFYSYAHEQQTYLAQSEYDIGLARWLAAYPREQLLVLCAEDYYRAPGDVMARLTSFLGLPAAADAGSPGSTGSTGPTIRNAAPGADLDAGLRARLAAHFAEHNHAVEALTGERFPWS